MMTFNAVAVFDWVFIFFKYIWPYCALKALLSGLLPVLPRSLLVKPHISETAIGSSSTISYGTVVRDFESEAKTR